MSGATILYVPVSVIGDPFKNHSSFLRDALGISTGKKIILYFGLLWEKRYVLALAELAQNFPEDWVLVMHGEDCDSAVEKIKSVDRRNKVVISLNMVPSARIQEVVSSADIGLALYSPAPQNDRLTAFSSEKMALYMQCGVPFIGFDYPGDRQLASEHRCGVVIKDLQELPSAVSQILAHHDEFRQRAYQVFSKHFDFSRNFTTVVECLNELVGSPWRAESVVHL
jgi:glycosyltransferase involved in cell wall biosynthesis